MSNAIEFLEAAGRNAAVSTAEYAAIVGALDMDASQKQALLERDLFALNRLLDGREKLFCLVATPENEEPAQDDTESEDVPDEGRAAHQS